MIIATATTTCTFTGIIPENNLPVSAAEEVMKTDDGFQYEVNNNGEVTITKYIGTDTDVDIPSKIDGKPVTSIGEYAFYNYNDLISVTMFQIKNPVSAIGAKNLIEITNHHPGILKLVVLRLTSFRTFLGLKSQPIVIASHTPTKIKLYALHQLSTISSQARPAPVMNHRERILAIIQRTSVVFLCDRWNLSDIAVDTPSIIEKALSIASVQRQKQKTNANIALATPLLVKSTIDCGYTINAVAIPEAVMLSN